MKQLVIVPIVEGQSEVMAVPMLLRRLLSELQRYDVMVARPVRVHRSSVVKEGEIERAVVLARRNREGCRKTSARCNRPSTDNHRHSP